MDPDFWHQRWQDNRIGFHQDRVTPLLGKYWPSLDLPTDTQVFVPLAGKSLDLPWLASRGHRVLGVELSQRAIEQFFAEHALTPEIHDTVHGRHYIAKTVGAGDIELICGNVFDIDANTLSGCHAVFDRAALIALPPPLRQRYADEVYAKLPSRCRGLLITLDYPQQEKQGPPFSVPGEEVHALYGHGWTIIELARLDTLDKQPGFAAEGVTALHTAAYRLQRRDT